MLTTWLVPSVALERRSNAFVVCRHVHSATEWERVREASGRHAYPTKEEAEFTADLAFAVAIRLSAWAVKRGRAKLSLPRWTIKPQETGRRDFLVSLPPELLRREAMVGIGLRLGLSPPAELACSIPARRSLAEGFAPTTFRHAVFIGAGNLSYKMVAGPLAPRFFPGPGGDAALCVVKYAQLIRSDDTIQLSIEAIADWVENLICDCPWAHHATANLSLWQSCSTADPQDTPPRSLLYLTCPGLPGRSCRLSTPGVRVVYRLWGEPPEGSSARLVLPPPPRSPRLLHRSKRT